MSSIDWSKVLQLFEYTKGSPMIFSSGLFLFMFAAFICLYYVLRNKTHIRLAYVILFSLFFYYKSGGMYFLILLALSLFDYSFAMQMEDSKKESERKWLVFASIFMNLATLCYFKYTNFFYEIYCNLKSEEFSALDIVLPVGISFFTFQSLSYTIDVYRRNIRPVRNYLDYAFFISFFPQIVSGPIVRAKDFIPQIRQPLTITKSMFGLGFFLIVSGLFKKAVISDYISVNFVDLVFDEPLKYGGIVNLFAVYGYAMQIYCDFSGYSDMAIGFALLLGFKFPINFDSPYQSATITEFWRRWHISLSTWLRDYLYISLGGNRKGKIRTYINLLITMILGGLWHGPSLMFVCWGAIQGIALAIHKLLMAVFPILKPSGDKMEKHWRILSTIFNFHLICFSWIFFRPENFETSIDMLKQIFTFFRADLFLQMVSAYKFPLLVMLLGFVLHFIPKKTENKVKEYISDLPVWLMAAIASVLIVLIMQIKSADIQAFIYFQF